MSNAYKLELILFFQGMRRGSDKDENRQVALGKWHHLPGVLMYT